MFANPDKNVASLMLREGMRVADFGAGSGYLTVALARKVGHTGHVYAVEVKKPLVKRLENEIKSLGLSNVDCICGDIEKHRGSKLADGLVDAVIISNLLSQTEDRLGVIDEAKRILKKGGKVLLVDWEKSSTSNPNPSHLLSPRKAEELFIKRGFAFIENIAPSSHHYGIIFRHEK
jgi:ubiquinone/menaquinone biosynthesis C-methylase UbiE